MNYYNSARKQRKEIERCHVNVLQCLADNRDSKITFRLPLWMKQLGNEMKINKETERYIQFRNQLKIWKSEKYLSWMKSKYPQMDLHHLLGSKINKKFRG